MTHKAGFVNIIGQPNVGKSTLINQLVGEKVAITTPKAQTTRHRILGMVNAENYQVIFSDTPGIIDQPKYLMQQAMMRFVNEAKDDADIILLMVEVGQKLDKIAQIMQETANASIPALLVVNKIDKVSQEKALTYVASLHQYFPPEKIFPVSALQKHNVEVLFNAILEMLPEHPAFYEKDIYSDKSERFLASEIIREKIFQHFKQEIPYSVEVVVHTFKNTDERLFLGAEIYVNRKSQKGIIIGHQGKALTGIGKLAREELITQYKKPVHLDLYVKVKEGWREDQRQLKRFGYQTDGE